MSELLKDPKVEQFVQLLPLSLAIAGLSRTESGKYLTEEQMEMRARTVKHAYKQVQILIREIAKEQ